jgi:hypothetical protein
MLAVLLHSCAVSIHTLNFPSLDRSQMFSVSVSALDFTIFNGFLKNLDKSSMNSFENLSDLFGLGNLAELKTLRNAKRWRKGFWMNSPI